MQMKTAMLFHQLNYIVITKISNTYFCSEFEEHLESMNKAS